MSYSDPGFWEAYEQYLKGAMPIHQKTVDMLVGDVVGEFDIEVLFDLGCGLFREAETIIPWETSYKGFDQVLPEGHPYRLDYRAEEGVFVNPQLIEYMNQDKADTFCSFFSSECTESFVVNHSMYREIFKQVPTMQWGIVSGFYYSNRIHEYCVEEAGGIRSWQSNQDLYGGDFFKETRVLIRNPSIMFGDDVVEVWRLLERT